MSYDQYCAWLRTAIMSANLILSLFAFTGIVFSQSRTLNGLNGLPHDMCCSTVTSTIPHPVQLAAKNPKRVKPAIYIQASATEVTNFETKICYRGRVIAVLFLLPEQRRHALACLALIRTAGASGAEVSATHSSRLCRCELLEALITAQGCHSVPERYVCSPHADSATGI